MSETPDPKTRRNAILTWERVDELATSQIRTEEKLDALLDKVKDIKDAHIDHEVRIRALELLGATFQTTNSNTAWVVTTVLSAAAAIGAIAILFVNNS
jgi:hypothetical protein